MVDVVIDAVNTGKGTTTLESNTSSSPPFDQVVFWAKATANSGDTYGVFGQSDSTNGIGVNGWASATSGGNAGVFGQSDSHKGLGVQGYATAASGICVSGYAGDPGAIPFVATGDIGQTANLQEWQNNAGKALSVVDKNGNMGIGTSTPKTTLQVNGSVSVAVKTVTSAYTMTASDFTILANASAALTITLPPASNTGMMVHVKKIDSSTHHVTLSRAGSDTIEGATTKELKAKYHSLTLIADGTRTWYILSNAT